MKTIIKISLLVVLVFSTILPQPKTFQDSLLNHMTGKWVLKGTIAGQETIHDVAADWVLGHQYLQFHEISREKNAEGEAAYEAIVFIGWDQPTSQYTCLWLDVTGSGGLSGQAIAYAKLSDDKIAFLFKDIDGSVFHTTFVYVRNNDSWQWIMDNDENGKLKPFARVTLTRE